MSLLRLIRVPLFMAAVWAVLGIASEALLPSGPAVDAAWLFVRAVIAATAGYFATRGARFGLLAAAIAGALVMLVDHVVVKGGVFLLQGEFRAAAGVVISYIMFVWIAMVLGLVGGVGGKLRASRGSAA